MQLTIYASVTCKPNAHQKEGCSIRLTIINTRLIFDKQQSIYQLFKVFTIDSLGFFEKNGA